MDNITFQSRIKLIEPEVFKQKIKNLNPKRHEVGYPWTPNQIKTGKNLYTTKVQDCISGGIVQDGKVTMFHFCTYNQKQAKKNHQKGFNIEEVKRRLLEKIDLTKENIHAFILGGYQLQETSKYNVNKLKKIKQFFIDNKIPLTTIGALRDVHYYGSYSLLYENKSDTWFVTHSVIGKTSTSGKGKHAFIHDGLITYDCYQTIRDKRGICRYPCERKTTNFEEYFKSQFRDVSLSKFDEFV